MDIEYLLFLQSIREMLGSLSGLIMNIITYASTAAPFVVFILYWGKDKKLGQYLFANYAFGAVVNNLIKNTFCVYRPWIRDARVTPYAGALEEATGYSFPSGHSQGCVSTYGGIAKETKNGKLRIAMIVLTALVCFSRNFLGVHTPQDVVVGIIEGIVILFAVSYFFAWYGKKERNDLVAVLVGMVLIGLACAYTLLKGYPLDIVNGEVLVDPKIMMEDGMRGCGFLAGGMIGWYLEKHHVGFGTDGIDTKTMLKRILIGFVITLPFYVGGGYLKYIMDARFACFIKTFTAAFAGMYLSPLVFKMTEKKTD